MAVNADYSCFEIEITFLLEAPERDYEHVRTHYRYLSAFYFLEMMLWHRDAGDAQLSLYDFCVRLRKTEKSAHLRPARLKKIFEADLQILQQLYLMSEVKFSYHRSP